MGLCGQKFALRYVKNNGYHGNEFLTGRLENVSRRQLCRYAIWPDKQEPYGPRMSSSEKYSHHTELKERILSIPKKTMLYSCLLPN